MPIPKKQQDSIMVSLDITQPETLINRKVWSKKDIKMMVKEDDLHSREVNPMKIICIQIS